MDAWRTRLRAAGDASLPPSSPLRPSLARASSSAALKPPSREAEGRDDPFGFLAAERRRRSRRQLDSEMRPFASNSSSALSIAQRGPIPHPASVYCDAGDDYAARPSSRSSSIFHAETPRPARHLPVPSSSSAASAILHQAQPSASRPASKSASSSRAVLRQKDANIPATTTESSSSASHKAKAKYKYKSDTKTARQHRKKRPDSPAVGMHATAPAAENDDEVVVDPEEQKRKRIAYFKALDEYELHKEDVYII